MERPKTGKLFPKRKSVAGVMFLSTLKKASAARKGSDQGHRSVLKRRISKQSAADNDEQEKPDKETEKKPSVPPLVLFRKAVGIVRIFYRCCKLWMESSRESTQTSFIETRFFAMKAAEEANKVGFDKTEYSRGFGSTMPNSAKETLAKPPLERTDKELALLRGLLRGLNGFRQFSTVIQRAICRTLQYCRYGGNRILIRKGHIGQRFYLVFSGSVFINDSELDKVTGVTIPVTVNTLYRGSSFGEYALVKDVPRSATVLSREPVELLYVDREDFMDVQSNSFELEIRDKMKFVENMPLFESWESDSLEDILIQTNFKEYPIGITIEEDGVKSPWVYVVMEGKCKVFRRLDVKKLKTKVVAERKNAAMSLWVKNSVMPPLCVWRPKQKKASVDQSVPATPTSPRKFSDQISGDTSRQRQFGCSEFSVRKRSSTADNVGVRRWSRTPVRRGTRAIMLDEPVKTEEEVTPEMIDVFMGIMTRNDAFDLAPLITKRQDISLKLVSAGAKVLRFPKRKFFLLARNEQLDSAKKCAITFRSDGELYDAYCEYKSWQRYRCQVMEEEICTQVNKGVLRAERNAEQALGRMGEEAAKPLELPRYFDPDRALREDGGMKRQRRRVSSGYDHSMMSTTSLASTRGMKSSYSMQSFHS
eukprot:m.14488 g.14488  ORF g.14488 m.14488 type:complete len:648 (+) comp25764_c0_seq3:404-2347(+)